MTKTMRKAMISTIAMLVVAVMSLTGVTYAWFTQANNATVEGMTMGVVAADGGLQISTSSTGGWKNALTIEDTEDRTGVAPVSTVDAVNFFKAQFNPANSDQFKTVANDATNNVWTQVLYIKNTGYDAITVDFGGTEFKDTYTSDTRDASGAARLAVFVYESLESGATKELAFILSDEEYTGVKKASDNYFAFATDTEYLGDPTNLQTSAASCTFDVPAGTSDGTTFTEAVVKIEVVVWLEGQDSDCVNKNSNSAFDVNLVLNATKTVTTQAAG